METLALQKGKQLIKGVSFSGPGLLKTSISGKLRKERSKKVEKSERKEGKFGAT